MAHGVISSNCQSIGRGGDLSCGGAPPACERSRRMTTTWTNSPPAPWLSSSASMPRSNRPDVDGIMAAMTDDCVFENTSPAPDGKRYQGAAALRSVWEQFFEASPQATFDI